MSVRKTGSIKALDPGERLGSKVDADGLTVGSGVAQNLCNILVSGVLAQSAHDVGHLVVGHLVVTDSVKETERLLEVWSGRKNQEKPFSYKKNPKHTGGVGQRTKMAGSGDGAPRMEPEILWDSSSVAPLFGTTSQRLIISTWGF